MQRQLANMKQSLFDQGYLDEQFVQLEELQDDANPHFVEEVVTLYYRDSARLIQNIEQALRRTLLIFLSWTAICISSRVAVQALEPKKVKTECTQFREYCRAGNGEGCKRTFQQLKKEYATLKKKLEVYFQFARQVGPVEKACRPK